MQKPFSIDVYYGHMYVVTKGIKQLFIFDLDNMTYRHQTTIHGLFDGQPDQMKRILDGKNSDLLYFCEEQGTRAGSSIHARDVQVWYYTIFESPVYPQETTGLWFSPGSMHMYVAYQVPGVLFDIWREDGLPFGARRTLDVQYHTDWREDSIESLRSCNWNKPVQRYFATSFVRNYNSCVPLGRYFSLYQINRFTVSCCSIMEWIRSVRQRRSAKFFFLWPLQPSLSAAPRRWSSCYLKSSVTRSPQSEEVGSKPHKGRRERKCLLGLPPTSRN